MGRIGCAVICVLLFLAAAAPWIAPYDPYVSSGRPFESPTLAHWFGTNDVGHDLASELLYAARTSLAIGFWTAILSTILGTGVALAAGYSRGRLDALLMGCVDLALSLPFLPLAIVLSVYLGSGRSTIILALSAVLWSRAAREIRSQVLSVQERDYVQAGRAMGGTHVHIIRRHILPAVASLIVPQFLRAFNRAVFYETSLSFLGLGDPAHKSWGVTLFYANAHGAFLTDAWMWWVIPPVSCIAATNLSLAFVGRAVGERTEFRRVGSMSPVVRTAGRPLSASAAPHRLPQEAFLSVRDLVSVYMLGRGKIRAVDGVSIELKKGEVLGIVGPSGCGKTTLATSILRLQRPGQVVHGTVLFDGVDLLTLSAHKMRALRGSRIAFIPQNAMNALNPLFRIRDQVAEAVMLHQPLNRREGRQKAMELLEAVRIPSAHAGAYPHELSGGMRQRAVLAMALANAPDLLIADEPTSNLDTITQKEILNLLAEFRARHGMSMILISHDPRLIRKMSDTVMVMAEGKIVVSGSVAELERQSADLAVRSLFEEPRMMTLRPAPERTGASKVILQVNGLCRRFSLGRGRGFHPRSEIRALEDVSLEVREGEFVGVIGASGAGKTTLARLVVGLIPPSAGQMIFNGHDPASSPNAAIRGIRRPAHLVFQDPYESLNPRMRVEDLIAEPLMIHGVGDPAGCRGRVFRALSDVGLTPAEEFAGRYPHELSGGQRQRVALARGIVMNPLLIVADEPTSMLDASLRSEFLDTVLKLKLRHRLAGLFMTHDLSVARAICDRLVILHDGRVVEEGPFDRVIRAPRHPYSRALIQAAE